MARSVSVRLGGKVRILKGSFAASEAICERVCDLMVIQREAQLGAMMAERGIPYQPKWAMNAKDVVNVLEIACDASGADLERESIEADVFSMGFDVAHNHAIAYLGLFFAAPEADIDGDKKEDAREKK